MHECTGAGASRGPEPVGRSEAEHGGEIGLDGGMALTTADARRWLQGFEAAERVDREAMRARGPRPEWSIALALSLIDAARAAAEARSLLDARRTGQDDRVREVWARLRSSLILP